MTQPQPNQPQSSPFVRACRGEPVPYTPVWFMRQAGRSLPEYKRVREGIAMLDSCTRPELVTEITLQPLRRYDVDAAVLYSDIVVPLRAVGVNVDIKPGVGPVVAEPVRTLGDVARLRPLEPADVPFIGEAVKSLVGELGGKPLIGFAGGPFTLASYLVEGGPSKNHDKTKALMYGAPELWHALMSSLADIAIGFLQAQIEAGASAVQLFDSWVGVVSPQDYRQSILPHTRRIFSSLAAFGVPRIHFGVGTGELLGLLGEAGADVVGVDWRIPLDEAARRVGNGKALQGNLDPSVLLAGWDVVEPRARAVLDDAKGLPGHVFNLGHGVLPETDPDILARLADLVHEATARLQFGGNIGGHAHNGAMRIRIEGTDLPGTTCGPSPDRPEGHRNIHVGVQRRGKPAELLGVVPGDSTGVAWTLEATASRTPGGDTDLRGPYIQGPPGGRFIYLNWGTVDTPGEFRMFRRAKLRLDAVPAEVLRSAAEQGVLVGRVGLTDAKGNPTCASVSPPLIQWSAETA